MRRLAAALALLAAMPALAETVTGTVTWPEPAALPPAAVLEVAVEDISRADAPSTTLARFAVSPVGGPPVAFEVEVPAPDARATLSVRATIRQGGALLFTTDTVAPVLTRGAPAHADLTLIRVAAPSSPALAGIDWRLVALGGAPLPPEAREPALRFDATADGATFAASAGCNRFGGTARIDGDALAFGPARATRMACPPPLDAAEAALSAAFAATVRWQVDGATLRLLDAAGTVLLEATAP
ncbi:MAG: META domain-containing protein [Rhodobacteraceae bacterium]|nr:META domain-containing protein [Paracoccaceae bacterium]